MSSIDAVEAPDVVLPDVAPSREQRRAERRAVAEAEVWLAHQAMPADAVVWYPHWSERRPVVVEDGAHLARLIGLMVKDEFGGIKLFGSRGPWAQVMGGVDGEFLLELHSHAYDDEPGGMYFERVVPISAASAGALGWAWVRREELPAEYGLEPRVVPCGQMLDRPM